MCFNIFKRKKNIDKQTGEKIFTCPRDGKEMKKIVKHDVVLDVCQKCGGMWVDAGELDKLHKLSKSPEAKKSSSKKKRTKKT